MEIPQCQHLIHLFLRDKNLNLIVFNLRVDCLRRIEDKDALLLDLLLALPKHRFKALREVRFRYEGQLSCAGLDVSEKLRRVFPELVRHKLLSITTGSWVSPSPIFIRLLFVFTHAIYAIVILDGNVPRSISPDEVA